MCDINDKFCIFKKCISSKSQSITQSIDLHIHCLQFVDVLHYFVKMNAVDTEAHLLALKGISCSLFNDKIFVCSQV